MAAISCSHWRLCHGAVLRTTIEETPGTISVTIHFAVSDARTWFPWNFVNDKEGEIVYWPVLHLLAGPDDESRKC